MDITTEHRLANGVGMPMFGLGVYKALGDEATKAVACALGEGYRLVDTAAFYGNEAQVAEGIRQGGKARGEVFVTSKLWADDVGYRPALVAFEAALGRFGFDYLDLYLVHWPIKGHVYDTWRAMEEILESGRARAIGVSNFPVRLLEEMKGRVRVMPMVNQVQLHPLMTRRDEVAWCRDNGVLLQAWAPLARAKLMQDARIEAIAQRHGKTPAQVILHWDLQQGVATIPKSVTPSRIAENAHCFDFELTEEEMDAISAMNRDETAVGPGPAGAILA